MKLYAISGLGADKRVYDFLKLELELIPLDWIEPKPNEDIRDYSLRLSASINTDEEFGIIGVSFGGLIAVEISKNLNPKLTISISSIETDQELPLLYRAIGKLGIAYILPKIFFTPPKSLSRFLFGTKNTETLYPILEDTDPAFAKWAVTQLLGWENKERIAGSLKICGDKDFLLLSPKRTDIITIKGGGHFMIVDKAEEISAVINKKVRSIRPDSM
ncbi:hypothetical protein FUAX_27030 [Fulvitalea axinellae]|uniref:Alpha/beta hydrolase n=1 Tax=Fulvitalea axinellae TaxID=1182444 RepID=A0AAU9DB35_9BACT|nr:hypothetical protein FUAX_27030 [Fulvitalea axinellae]